MKTPPDRTFYKNKEKTLREAEVTAHTNVGRVKSTMRVLSLSSQKPPFPAEPPRHSRPFHRHPCDLQHRGAPFFQRLTYFTSYPLHDTHPLPPWGQDPNFIHLRVPRDWLWVDTQVTKTDDLALWVLLGRKIPPLLQTTQETLPCVKEGILQDRLHPGKEKQFKQCLKKWC